MIEVHPGLYVGSAADLKRIDRSWFVVHAAKEPWHREFVGYQPGKAAPKGPEYYFALRGNRLALNLIDAEDPKFIPDSLMDEGCSFISRHINEGKVLVHCNQGQSRGPGLAFLWLWRNQHLSLVYEVARREFAQVYPQFQPKAGIEGFLRSRCVVAPSQADKREPVEGILTDEQFAARFG